MGGGRRRRRLPHRHRQARQHGLLEAVRPRVAGLRRLASATTTSSCSARSSTPTRASCRGTRPRVACRPPSTSASRAAASTSPRASPRRELRDFFALDDYFTDADSNVYSLPTFLGNHDMGRVGSFLRQGTTWDDAQLLTRDELAHSLMYLTRGQPVVYYGDEQGFSAPPNVPGGIGDQRAREDMFPSQVALHNDTYDLIGTDATTADANFDTGHPLYQHIADLAELRENHPALADGAQIHRYATSGAGHLRIQPDGSRRATSSTSSRSTTPTPSRRRPSRPSSRSAARSRACGRLRTTGKQLKTDAEGRVTVTVPPLSAVVYRATAKLRADTRRPRAGVLVAGRGRDRHRPRRDRGRHPRWRLHPGDVRLAARRRRRTGSPSGPTTTPRTASSTTSAGWPRARPWSTGPSPVTTTATSAWSPPARSSGSRSRRPTRGSTSGRSRSRRLSRVPGSHGSEIGCAADWDPPCDNIQLALGRRPGLEGHLQPAGRPVRVQGGDQPLVGRELRRGRQPQRVGHLLRHRRRRR